MRLRSKIACLFAVASFAGCADFNQAQRPSRHASDPVSTIVDRHALIESVRTAITNFAKTPQPSFWIEIANDPTYSLVHRRLCVFELFRRHVRVGMKLRRMNEVLGDPKWLQDGDIHLVRIVVGWIPVELQSGDSVFCIWVLPEPGRESVLVYLRVSGDVPSGDFDRLLLEKDDSAGASINRELGVVEIAADATIRQLYHDGT